MGKILSILIVEDDPDWIEIISNEIRKHIDMHIAAIASNVEDAVKATSTLQDLDVVLMDISLSENNFDGLEAAASILQIRSISIIMLTAMQDKDVILKSIGLGVADYILKEEVKRIPDAIRSALKGTSVSKTTFGEINRLRYEVNKYKKMTRSEKELYEYKENGYSMSQISKMMSKSVQTLKNQLNTMYKKFDVTDFNELTHKIRQ